MLLGQYEGTITEKQQISLPSKFRQVLGNRIIISKGFEQCLIVVSEKEWKTLLEGTEGRSFTNKATRDIQRFLLGNASFIELDSKGRCVLPAYLRDYATLKEEIIFAGIQRFVEIWSKSSWNELQKTLAVQASSIAELLSKNEKEHEQ